MRIPVRCKALRAQFNNFNFPLLRVSNEWPGLIDNSYSHSPTRLPFKGIRHSHSTHTIHYLSQPFFLDSNFCCKGSLLN